MILYLVWVSQLLAHNVDAMKHCANLSYFAKWIFYFTASVMSLESLHLKNNISLLWESDIVTKYPAVDFSSEAEEGGVKADNSSVNVGSTIYHYRENVNSRRLPKDSKFPSLDTDDAAQTGYKYFPIGMCETLYRMNNMEFNRQFGVTKFPLEPPVRQYVPLHSPPPPANVPTPSLKAF